VPTAGEDTNLRPIIPETIKSRQNILNTSFDSLNRNIPKFKVT